MRHVETRDLVVDIVIQAVLVVLRFELRVDGYSQLAGDKRHQHDDECRGAQELVAADDVVETTLRCDAQQGDGNEQVEPQPRRRHELVKTQHERQQRNDTGNGIEQPPDGDRDDQDEEEVE